MNDIQELVGRTVTALVDEDENGEGVYIDGKVLSVEINSYYFEDKNEPIYITAVIQPIVELPKDFDWECLAYVSLCNIRKKLYLLCRMVKEIDYD